MKSVALTALASAYFTQSWHWSSFWHWSSGLAIGAGFTLNLAAARALGHTRTYYGWELGELPTQRVTSFPYSVVPHPMLVGNMLAFGGTLLHPGFRTAWWPLAVVHVALNGALIVMETSVTPARQPGASSTAASSPAASSPAAWSAAAWSAASWTAAIAAGAAFVTAAAAVFEWPAGWVPVAIVAGASAAYGYVQRGWYVPAESRVARNHTRSQEVV